MTTLEQIKTMAQKARSLRAAADDLTAKAKALEEDAAQIEEEDLPDALDEVGMDSFTLEDGTKVTLKPIVAASIPAKHREQALAWLVEHGHEGLIKTNVTLAVPRERAAQVPQLLRVLEALSGMGDLQYEVTVGQGVHTQTLGAWVREYLDLDAAGEALPPLPMELLGIFMGRKAQFKEGKR